MQFNIYLKKCRERYALTQEKLVQELFNSSESFSGLDIGGLSRWERGVSLPSIDRQVKIVKLFQTFGSTVFPCFESKKSEEIENEICTVAIKNLIGNSKMHVSSFPAISFQADDITLTHLRGAEDIDKMLQMPHAVMQSFTNKQDVFGQQLYAFESLAWERFDLMVIELTEMKRTTDGEFTHILSKVRKGVCDEEVEAYMMRLWNNEKMEKDPTYLYGRNLEVEQTNRAKINELETEETILFANIEMFGSVHEKKLLGWKKMLPISEQLTLKEGVPILFTVNKWGKFVNGERGILHKIEEDYLIVKKEAEYVRVERHEFDLLDMLVKEDGTVETMSLATLSQFPLKLAYAVTIHKSQGMSIDNLVCNVDNIFAPSQFYVAISRAVNPKNLKLDFNKGDLTQYLRRVIHVDQRVIDYYQTIE